MVFIYFRHHIKVYMIKNKLKYSKIIKTIICTVILIFCFFIVYIILEHNNKKELMSPLIRDTVKSTSDYEYTSTYADTYYFCNGMGIVIEFPNEVYKQKEGKSVDLEILLNDGKETYASTKITIEL